MTLKEEIEEILHPERGLHAPPRAPIVSEKEVGDIERCNHSGKKPDHKGLPNSKPTIDFKAMANASEFQRFIYWIRTGKVFRGSNEALKEDLWETQKDIEIINDLKKIDPNAKNFGNVINEFKDKVEKLKRKRS